MSTTRAPLRAVTPSTRTKRAAQRQAISECIDGEERDLLVALRAKLAEEVDGGIAHAYLAGIVRQLRDIDHAIREIDRRAEEALEDPIAPDEPWHPSLT